MFKLKIYAVFVVLIVFISACPDVAKQAKTIPSEENIESSGSTWDKMQWDKGTWK